MRRQNSASQVPSFGKQKLSLAALAFCCLAGLAVSAEAGPHGTSMLEGVVESGTDSPNLLSGYEVSLYASYLGGIPFKRLLGTDTTDGGGHFEINYKLPPGLWSHDKVVLYVLAEKGDAMLASAIGDNDDVVVNELTTVATGTAFAQFIDGRYISGNKYGMLNAVMIAANMANPHTGEISEVLDQEPNGADTSTRATFYSMANIVAACIDSSGNCGTLFADATPIGGSAPTTVLQAVANMTKFPSSITISDSPGLFTLSGVDVYSPALSSEPTSWLLFIKFTGEIGPGAGDYKATNLLSGPGQIGFDERGFAWINDNYNPSDFDPSNPGDFDPNPPTPESNRIGCAGARLLKFYPWGEPVPGTPYFGGGLSGAGYGITLDPRGKIWVGNFGFESPLCTVPPFPPPPPEKKIPATHNSVSLFQPNGTSIFGTDGLTKGHLWWPQGMASDKKGNIWIGNCGNDTVTLMPRGNPRRAQNFALPGGLVANGGDTQPPLTDEKFGEPRPVLKPFGLALDPKGRAWVVGNSVGYGPDVPAGGNYGGVFRISKDGTIHEVILPEDNLLSFPMGIAGDSKGNMWVSNSDKVFVPCVTPFTTDQGGALGPSVTFIPADSTDASGALTFGTAGTGGTGGLTIPWGNFVDGNDTLWVFNFGVIPFDIEDNTVDFEDTSLSHFCGVDTSKCPAGLSLGDAISPSTGYQTNALDRVTGGGVDRSGNIWILNNWKKSGPYNPVFIRNPGGNSFVIVPGAAAPVKTPVLGPPEGFGDDKHFASFALLFYLPFVPWLL